MKRSLSWLALAVLSCVAFGCTGDDPRPTKAMVTVSATGTLPTGNKIGAVQVALQAPAGLVITMDPNAEGQPLITGIPTDPSDATYALAGGSYASATNTVTVGVMCATGFATGNIFTVTYAIPSTVALPNAGDFALTVDTLSATSGADLRPDIGVTTSVQLQ